MANIIQPIITRIDTTTNWRTLNPVPKNGEQCIEDLGKGLFKLKIGDGITPWIALAYWTSQARDDSVNQTILNITQKYPLQEGRYYSFLTALEKLQLGDVQFGQIITFASNKDKWDLYQFTGQNRQDYTDPTKWERLDYKVEANPDLEEIADEPVVVTFDKKGLVTGFAKVIDCGTF